MKKITKEQLKKLHVMLNQMRLMEHKALLVFQYTRERTEHSSEMHLSEAAELIKHLTTLSSTDQAADRMRKKCFALAYEAGIIYGDTPEDKKMNAAKLNVFLLKGGTVKKELNKMTHAELIKVVNQFQQIVKHSSQTSANKATKALLEELNIPVVKASQESH